MKRDPGVRDSFPLNANAADLRTDAIVSMGVVVSLALVRLTGAGWLRFGEREPASAADAASSAAAGA